MKLPKIHRREIRAGTAVLLCAMTAVVSFHAAYIAMERKLDEELPNYRANNELYGKLGEIRSLFDQLYVGTYDEKDAIDVAAAGYVAGVGDRWSGYYSAEDYEAYVTSFLGQSSGIGAYVSYAPDSGMRIVEVYKGSACDKAGLQKGDRILSADGVSIEQDGYSAVMEAIAGDEGTSVRIGVERAATGETEEIEMTRSTAEQTMVTGWMLENNVGFVRIYNFHQGSEKQFKTIVKGLLAEGAEAFVFDVRNDPGGSVDSVNEMLDLLLPEGDLMSLASKAGKEEQYTSDADCVELPMAVLVDAESISAAEFFAACLQEYGWATVVGEQTIGKGYSQRMYALTDGSAVRISDKTYYMPSGKSLIGTGVTPDVEIGLPEEKEADFYFLTPEEDDQLAAALETLR